MVPAADMASNLIGWQKPEAQASWPSSEYRYSIHSLAALGCGAKALIACTYTPARRPSDGTIVSISGLPARVTSFAMELYDQSIRIGVSPIPTVRESPSIGTKLPASLS